MRADEIERFFAARVVGHRRAGDGDPRARRRTGSSAPARSASSTPTTARRCIHITIGETDAWGHGLRHRGDPADARPRVRDARACTASRCSSSSSTSARSGPTSAVGFVVEGRARESIWRDGRWWDELAMSMLETDWRRIRDERTGAADRSGRARPTARPARRRAGQIRDDRGAPSCSERSEVAMTTAGPGAPTPPAPMSAS